MRKVLENGCEIIQGQGVRVGLMQTEEPGKREAWLYWLEGQGVEEQRDWRFCSRTEAIVQINIWLECIGLALGNGEIVEF